MTRYTTPATAGALTEPKGAKLDDLGIVFPIDLVDEPGAFLAAIRAEVDGGDPWEAAYGALSPERRSQKLRARQQRRGRLDLGHAAGRQDPAALDDLAVALESRQRRRRALEQAEDMNFIVDGAP